MDIGTRVKFRHDVRYMGKRVIIPRGTTGHVISKREKFGQTFVLVRFDMAMILEKLPNGLQYDLSTAYVQVGVLEKVA